MIGLENKQKRREMQRNGKGECGRGRGRRTPAMVLLYESKMMGEVGMVLA